MKKIIMMRHAKSSWKDYSIRDHDRPLNARGKRDAPLMAAKLHALVPHIDHGFVSTSKRTRLTVDPIISLYRRDIAAVTYTSDLYHGMPEDYEKNLWTVDDELDTILMVGHNPGLTLMAMSAQADDIIENVPTSGIFILEHPADRWVDVQISSCRRTAFLYPKMFV